jgi:hypothetical protein
VCGVAPAPAPAPAVSRNKTELATFTKDNNTDTTMIEEELNIAGKSTRMSSSQQQQVENALLSQVPETVPLTQAQFIDSFPTDLRNSSRGEGGIMI